MTFFDLNIQHETNMNLNIHFVLHVLKQKFRSYSEGYLSILE